MASNSFTTTILVDQSPQVAFEAINRPREWWGREIEGRTDHLGEEWTYRYKNMHFSRHRTTELVPDQRVVWRVVDSQMNFLKDKEEWKDTELTFDVARKGGQTEIRFTHVGLVPGEECFDICTDAWSGLIGESLKGLIENGRGLPDTVE